MPFAEMEKRWVTRVGVVKIRSYLLGIFCWTSNRGVLKFFFSTFIIYFWDRERQSMNGGGAEREGNTESETGSRLRAISPEPDAGLELTDREIVTWLKSDA